MQLLATVAETFTFVIGVRCIVEDGAAHVLVRVVSDCEWHAGPAQL